MKFNISISLPTIGVEVVLSIIGCVDNGGEFNINFDEGNCVKDVEDTLKSFDFIFIYI